MPCSRPSDGGTLLRRPSVRAKVVLASEVAGPVSPNQRRAQIRRRAAHSAWRYRT